MKHPDMIKSKSGLIEDFTGRLILLLIFLLVALLIYGLISGKMFNIGSGMEWLI